MSTDLIPFGQPYMQLWQSTSESPRDLVPSAPEDALQMLRACVSSLATMNQWEALIGPMAGAVLAKAAADPEVYRQAGYKKLGDFEKGEVTKYCGRTRAYTYKGAVECWPDAPLEKLGKAGFKNLQIAVAVARNRAMSRGQRERLLDQAISIRSVDEYMSWVEEESNLSATGEVKAAGVTLYGTKAMVQEFEEYMEEPALAEWAEAHKDTSKERDFSSLRKVLAALQESQTEWVNGNGQKSTSGQRAAD